MIKPKRPTDIMQRAKFIADIATGTIKEPDINEGKNPIAVEIGRKGGLKGGKARAIMRQKNLVEQIKKSGKKHFKTSDFEFLSKSPSFLSKHAKDNPGKYTEYFIRVSKGIYKLISN